MRWGRTYQFGLRVGDLAVILLQYFLQLFAFGFFFFLDGRHGAELAHERDTAATATLRPAVQASHTHTHTHTHTHGPHKAGTHSHTPTHNLLMAAQKGLFSITHMTTLGHSLQSTRIVCAVLSLLSYSMGEGVEEGETKPTMIKKCSLYWP